MIEENEFEVFDNIPEYGPGKKSKKNNIKPRSKKNLFLFLFLILLIVGIIVSIFILFRLNLKNKHKIEDFTIKFKEIKNDTSEDNTLLIKQIEEIKEEMIKENTLLKK